MKSGIIKYQQKSIHRKLWILFLSDLLTIMWIEVIHGYYSQNFQKAASFCEQ